jgi:hypothetical protein
LTLCVLFLYLLHTIFMGKSLIKKGIKNCYLCHKKYPRIFLFFGHNKSRPDGFTSACKKCIISHNTKSPAHRYRSYRSGSRLRNITFNISKQEFLRFWNKPCFYCNHPIKGIGLDRVNNSKGYSLDNLVPCCHSCNRMKMNTPQTDFIDACKAIAARFP